MGQSVSSYIKLLADGPFCFGRYIYYTKTGFPVRLGLQNFVEETDGPLGMANLAYAFEAVGASVQFLILLWMFIWAFWQMSAVL